jgi:hypothetical protein
MLPLHEPYSRPGFGQVLLTARGKVVQDSYGIASHDQGIDQGAGYETGSPGDKNSSIQVGHPSIQRSPHRFRKHRPIPPRRRLEDAWRPHRCSPPAALEAQACPPGPRGWNG